MRNSTSLHPQDHSLTLIYCTELLNLGRDYPQGFSYFRPRLHRAFMTNAHLRDENEIREGIKRAEFVKKGEWRQHSSRLVADSQDARLTLIAVH